MNQISPTELRLYETDFASWIDRTAQLIRARKFDRVDWEAVVDELESLGRSDRRELKSRLEVLLQHLLKWQYQSNLRSNSWLNTIDEQRNRIADLLLDSPSLKPDLEAVLAESYLRGRKAASNETQLPIEVFSEECVYDLDRILNSDFLP
ncbi:MAG: DUF29 domain-containing protein [Cyanosarcina radialis HA8281-LM2]|jgi:hypothetical protein|nr:DUF29 domain-containing protein [Cyanosarcina radialis HA8281-LM2]